MDSFHGRFDGRNNRKVRKFLESETGTELEEFVEESGWNEDTELVLSLLEDSLDQGQVEYLEDRLGGLDHLKDHRDVANYALELVRGWLLEDTLVYLLREHGLNVSLTGEDSEREFLTSTTAEHDLEIDENGDVYRVELATDFGGFWQKNGLLDLRDNKYKKWKSRESSYLLGLDFSNQKFVLVTPEEVDAQRTPQHPYWNKPAYRINCEKIKFYSIDSVGKKICRKL